MTAISSHDNIYLTKSIIQLLFVSCEISMIYQKELLDHPCNYEHCKSYEKWGEIIQREILQPFFTQSYLSVPDPTTRIHSFRTASIFVLFLHFQVSKSHKL